MSSVTSQYYFQIRICSFLKRSEFSFRPERAPSRTASRRKIFFEGRVLRGRLLMEPETFFHSNVPPSKCFAPGCTRVPSGGLPAPGAELAGAGPHGYEHARALFFPKIPRDCGTHRNTQPSLFFYALTLKYAGPFNPPTLPAS